MSFFEFLLLFAIAGVCGAVGQAIAGVTRRGCLATIAIGFIGALLGRIVADKFDLPELWTVEIDTQQFPIVWSIIFAAVFVAVISLFTHRSEKK